MLGLKEGEIYLHAKHPLWDSLGVREDSRSEVLFQDGCNFNAGDSGLVNYLSSEGAVQFIEEGLSKCHLVVSVQIYLFLSPP